MKKHFLLLSIALAVIFAITGSFRIAAQDVKKNISTDKAKKVKTDITFPAGKLNINANGKSFCEGFYTYTRDFWKPEISYYEESETGYLDIKVEDDRDHKDYNDDDDNVWTIAFNPDVRNEFNLEMIAGESNINLQGCKIDRFDFDMIAGETKINLSNTSVPFFEFKAIAGEARIDLTGDWKNDLDAEIKGGVGELTILLPSKTGVKVNITGGLGEVHASGFDKSGRTYSNDLYGKTKSNLYVDITGGIGTITLRMED